jgi:hypothetical protein
MGPRTIYLTLCSCLLFASGCALEANAPAENGVDNRANTLSTTGGGEIKRVDPAPGEQGPVTTNEPAPPDPSGEEQQAGGDPGKPSPDPWGESPSRLEGPPVLPGMIDPKVHPNVK